MATDRYRLDWHSLEVESSGSELFSALVPADDFAALRRLPPGEKAHIIARGEEVIFSAGDRLLLFTPRVPGDYPSTESIIKKAQGPTFSVERLALMDAVKSVASRQAENMPIILKMPSSSDPMLYVVSGGKYGRPRVSVAADGSIGDLSVDINPYSVSECLDAFGETRVVIGAVAVNKPMRFLNAKENPTHQHLLMPIRGT